MRLSGIGSVSAAAVGGQKQSDAVRTFSRAATGGTALIPASPDPETAAPRHAVQHAAPFIAHLIATAQQSPQTRVLRQIEPEIARAAYAAGGTNPLQPRRTLRTA